MHQPQKFRPKLVLTGLAMVAVPLVFGLVFIAVLFRLVIYFEHETDKIRRINTTQSLVQKLTLGYSQASIDLIDLGFRNNKNTRKKYFDSMEDIDELYKQLDSFVGSNPSEIEAVQHLKETGDRLKEQYNEMYNNLTRTTDSIDVSYFISLQRFKKDTKPMIAQNMKALNHLNDVEKAVYAPDQSFDETQSRDNIKRILLIGVAANVLIALTMGYFFAKGIVRRLSLITDNSYRLASERELNPPLEGDDELAHLDDVFHHMARALHEAHRKERALIDSAVDVICSIGKDHTFRTVNPAAVSFFGYTQDDMIGTSLKTVVYGDDLAQVEDGLKQAIAEKQPVTIECRIKDKEGRPADVLWSTQWSEFDQRFFCVLHDVSRQKQLERLKQDFLSMVTHDMRTPLFSAMSLFTMLEEGIYGTINSTGLKRVSGTINSIERLARLIDDLLDLDKFDSGINSLEKKSIATEELLEAARQSVAGYAEQKHVSIEIDACELSINVDQDRIVQVLVNLLSNAVKFSPENSSVSMLAILGENSPFVEIQVVDKGCGIPEEHRAAVFDRFRQVHSSQAARDKKVKGTGLGLAIARAIVEAHGGTIGVESVIDEGTTFWFTIPTDQSE